MANYSRRPTFVYEINRERKVLGLCERLITDSSQSPAIVVIGPAVNQVCSTRELVCIVGQCYAELRSGLCEYSAVEAYHVLIIKLPVESKRCSNAVFRSADRWFCWQ